MFRAVLSNDAQTTLAVLGKSGLFSHAYLAGGTALALYFGHRKSVDFDFFTPIHIDATSLSRDLSSLGTFTEDIVKGVTLIGTFNGIKISCMQYAYPLLERTTQEFGVRIVHPHDIAAMKLVAISDRSTKKDFIDLYELHAHGVSFDMMFEFYEKKYHLFDSNKFTLIKSLTYFEDADIQEMPEMIRQVVWEDIKRFFEIEAVRLGKKFLEEKEDG